MFLFYVVIVKWLFYIGKPLSGVAFKCGGRVKGSFVDLVGDGNGDVLLLETDDVERKTTYYCAVSMQHTTL